MNDDIEGSSMAARSKVKVVGAGCGKPRVFERIMDAIAADQ